MLRYSDVLYIHKLTSIYVALHKNKELENILC